MYKYDFRGQVFAEISKMLNTTVLLHLIGCSLVPVSRQAMRMEDFADVASGKIINGKEVDEGEFPFLVELTRIIDRGHKCGGTILTKDWILTAAHCCDLGPPKCFSIYSGSRDRDGDGKNRIVKKFIIHENYDRPQNYKNDICLIKVFPPFILGKKVRRVKLPREDWQVPTGSNLLTAGWGFTTPEKTYMPNRMRKINMIAADLDQCAKEVDGFVPMPGYLCAQGADKGQGICQGDSGGPLMMGDVQVGITSWVLPPCSNGAPDFFVRVPYYVNWIKEKLRHEAHELKFAT